MAVLETGGRQTDASIGQREASVSYRAVPQESERSTRAVVRSRTGKRADASGVTRSPSLLVKQNRLSGVVGQCRKRHAEVLIGAPRRDATSWRALKETKLDQIWLIDIH